jgi:hypothetical protein
MNDGYLCKTYSGIPGNSWVKQVYDAGSSFIHLSNGATQSATSIKDETERIITMTIGKHDSFISNDQKFGSAFFMLKITSDLNELMQKWLTQKKNICYG